MTMLVALGAGLALGAAIAGAFRVNRILRERRRREAIEPQIENWEGEGGNVPSVPTPVPTHVPTHLPTPSLASGGD